MSQRILSPPFAARHQGWIVAIPTVALSLLIARWLALDTSSVPLGLVALLAVLGLSLAFILGPRVVFLGWLLVAPLLQNSADASSIGYDARWALYLGPGFVLVLMTVLRPESRPIRWFDPVPIAYVVYVFASLVLTSNLIETDTVGTGKAFFQIVVLGVIVYYFVVFGPGASISELGIAAALMVGAIIQSLLTFVERATSWNVWNDASWRDVAVPRPVSTLANPAILGMFIGVGIVLALAVIAWEGPRRLRPLSFATVVTGVPALPLTLTRGPVLATVLASVCVLLASPRTRLVGLSTIALSALLIVAIWPSIRQSEVYRDRVSNAPNVEARVLLQDWSLRLAAERPFTGWGYGSFDRVKNESDFGTGGLPPSYVLDATSHNTYLTVLVEYGGIGMLLLLLPWAAITYQAVRALPRLREQRWLVVGGAAALFVIAITASTADYRFFSLAQALPWLFVGLLRRRLP